MFVTVLLSIGLCIALLLTATAVMNLWTGVPSLPTPLPIVRAMIELAKLQGAETIIDLGAGDGRLLIEATRQFPKITARGWEIVPTVWLFGVCRIFLHRSKARLFLGDALRADVSQADVIFLYLFPSLLERLVERFDHTLKSGTRVVSHTFKLPGKTPIAEKTVSGYMGATSIYLYKW